MPKITPFLWFNDTAEDAANFYTSTFKNSRITSTTRYTKAGPEPEGSVMTIAFELDGDKFTALNGGPHFKFTEAISFVINCEDQQEVDYFWSKLTADGGAEGQCGWLKDKFGVSWQVVPAGLMRVLSTASPERMPAVMSALMKMKKIEVAELEAAAEGR